MDRDMTNRASVAPLAIIPGDRSGIGPEIVAKCLSDVEHLPDHSIVVIGDRAVVQEGARIAGVRFGFDDVDTVDAAVGGRVSLLHRPVDMEPRPRAQVHPAAGREVLDQIELLCALTLKGKIGGICYGPLNKQAMRLAGHAAGDELEFFATQMQRAQGFGEINVLGSLFTSRVTSHVPLAEVAKSITPDRVLGAARLLDNALRASGRARPRLALAALNPHAGEGGAYGTEEITVLKPAVSSAQGEGIDLHGPYPSDTVFPTAMSQGFDGVVTLFHDQGQIAIKMIGLGKSVTLLAGLPVPIASPGHGTAFDIAGEGVASADGMASAIRLVASMMGRAKTEGRPAQ